MPYSGQILRPNQKLSPGENPHEFEEHERLAGICDVCAWYEADHYTLDAMLAGLAL